MFADLVFVLFGGVVCTVAGTILAAAVPVAIALAVLVRLLNFALCRKQATTALNRTECTTFED
eukprot:2955108-Rhodomonas_salina.1